MLYNPFKFHIIETNQGFFIRKWVPFWYEYLEVRYPRTWSLKEHILNYCLFDTLEAAKQRLEMHYLIKNSLKVNKVYA